MSERIKGFIISISALPVAIVFAVVTSAQFSGLNSVLFFFGSYLVLSGFYDCILKRFGGGFRVHVVILIIQLVAVLTLLLIMKHFSDVPDIYGYDLY